MRERPRVCIIGAGASGIATCKILAEHLIPFDCFERSDRIGGMWAFTDAPGATSAYRSLHINTSRDKMQFSDFPMTGYPTFPHHDQVLEYFNAYADRFGLRTRITFNIAVEHCHRRGDGTWDVRLSTGETRQYDALCVANGHHWDPQWPEPSFPGEFDGQIVHSHYYIDPTMPADCIGKRVVVVGMGNSALDIACELGHRNIADRVFLSVRRGYYIVPKYIGSRTLDHEDPHPSEDPPFWQRLVPRWLYRLWRRRRIEAAIGRPEDYGLPKPDHKLGQTHPTISSEILIRIGSGDVIPKPVIRELRGDRVLFADGSEEKADVIFCCTGYRITFPFFDEDFVSAPGNEIALYKRIMHPRFHNLFFVALVQPLCAIMPIAEQQAKWIAACLSGRYMLPDQAEIDNDTQAQYEAMKRWYVASPRHTIQIDCAGYCSDLRRELRRGVKRAARIGRTVRRPRPTDAPVPDREAAE
jgi:cation diffusion facilitator CzcD-associated flavoprotein CzcO